MKRKQYSEYLLQQQQPPFKRRREDYLPSSSTTPTTKRSVAALSGHYSSFEFSETTSHFFGHLLLLLSEEHSLDKSQIEVMNMWDFVFDGTTRKVIHSEFNHAIAQTNDRKVQLLMKYGLYRALTPSLEVVNLLSQCIIESMDLKEYRLIALYHNLRGFNLLTLEDYSQALVDFDRAISLVPNYIISMTNRAHAYNSLGYTTKAYDEYCKLIRILPFYSEYYIDRADILADSGDNVGAASDYTTAIELDPNDPVAYFNRAVVYQQMDLGIHALRDMSTANRLDPEEQDYSEKYSLLVNIATSASQDPLFIES